VDALHSEVQIKYREVALSPGKGFHFQTGRALAQRLGYPETFLDRLPPKCVESFAGVGNPFSLGPIAPGEAVVDVGSGAGFDSLMAGEMVGDAGTVTGVDMTREMLRKARANARLMGASNVTFREGLAERLPIEDASADVVISNGVVNLVPNKEGALKEMLRVLKPGGRLYLSDIVVHKPVPEAARQNIELWTD
jgi:SAM-dependent methyltransferase